MMARELDESGDQSMSTGDAFLGSETSSYREDIEFLMTCQMMILLEVLPS